MLYSAKNRGFFLPGAKYPSADLSDAVEISAEEHQALLVGEQSGKILTPNKEGFPVLMNKLEEN